MYEVERDHNEVIVRSELMFDVSSDYKELVLSLKQARNLAAALLDASTAISWDTEEEDG